MQRVILFVVFALSSACSSDPEPEGTATGGTGSGAQGGASASGGSNVAGSTTNDGRLHGSVVVTLQQPSDDDGYTTAIGRFFDGAQPKILSLQQRSKQGDCTLFVPRAPFCSQPCAPAVCTADDVCTPYPTPRGVGTLTLLGIGATLELEPTSSMLVYQSPSLTYPPCQAGASVTAKATGVSVSAECIAPLQLRGPDPIPVTPDVPLRLQWVPAADGARSRIQVKLDVSHHGGSRGEINCDTADTGELEIAASLVTELLDLGLAGFPTINLNRVSVGTDAANPDLTLTLTSDLTRAVDTGVVSCVDDDACPEGKTCQRPSGICGP